MSRITTPHRLVPDAEGQADQERANVADGPEAIDLSRYVADICGELSKMTKSARLMMLSYLLAMAKQEAERIARDGSATG